MTINPSLPWESARPAKGRPMLWRVGQAGMILKSDQKLIAMDLFLTDHPMRTAPSMVKAEELAHADIVLGTHDHLDHIDRQAWARLLKASEKTVFVAPALLRDGLIADLKADPKRILGLDDGQTLLLDGVRLTGVASAHELLNPDPATGRYPCMGAVIELDGAKVYQPGDTCLYEGLAEKLRRFGTLDAMLLPINGRDGQRLAKGILGNMTFQEAVDLAGLLKPRLAIPTHYDMFQGNLEDPARFTDYLTVKYPGQACWVGEIGDCVTLGKGADD